MSEWTPFSTAPKDGTWIIGYTGEDELYVAIRWWDGYCREEDDDLSGFEEGEWAGNADVGHIIDSVTHWMPIIPHPDAPPKTTSFGTFDAAEGTVCRSRAERGITDTQVAMKHEFYKIIEERYDFAYPGDEEADAIWDEIEKKYGAVMEVAQ